VPDKKLTPKTALALLTALNLLNYIDRNVAVPVQDMVKAEFHRSDAGLRFLTSVFFYFLHDRCALLGRSPMRFSRKPVIIVGALVWSLGHLLTAITRKLR